MRNVLVVLLVAGCSTDDVTAPGPVGPDTPTPSSPSIPRDTTFDDTGAPPPDVDDDGWSAPADCDDDDPAVHPEAAEVCGDGTDNDCDGALCPLEGDLDLQESSFPLDVGALAGLARVAPPRDVDGDGISDLLLREWSTGDLVLYVGPVTPTSEPALRVVNPDACCMGFDAPLLIGPDLDGDGVRDLLSSYQALLGDRSLFRISADLRGEVSVDDGVLHPLFAPGGLAEFTFDGTTYLVIADWEDTGGRVAFVPTPLPEDAASQELIDDLAVGWFTGGIDASLNVYALTSSGDRDGDGNDDLVAFSWSPSSSIQDQVYWADFVPLGAVDFAVLPVIVYTEFGYRVDAVSLGDVDGGGVDLAIAARHDDEPTVSNVAIWNGPLDAEGESLHTADVLITPRTGCSAQDVTLLDYDGNGLDDVFVSDGYACVPLDVRALYAPLDGPDPSLDAADVILTHEGTDESDKRWPLRVRGGDMTGDGWADLAFEWHGPPLFVDGGAP